MSFLLFGIYETREYAVRFSSERQGSQGSDHTLHHSNDGSLTGAVSCNFYLMHEDFDITWDWLEVVCHLWRPKSWQAFFEVSSRVKFDESGCV